MEGRRKATIKPRIISLARVFLKINLSAIFQIECIKLQSDLQFNQKFDQVFAGLFLIIPVLAFFM